jgi:predicted alpha/beta-hydrolase family hydrolase
MPPTASRDTALLLTHSGDFYTIDLVAKALTRRGVRPVRFNTDLFPSRVQLAARAGDERAAHIMTETAEQVSTDEVCAVWARKIWTSHGRRS